MIDARYKDASDFDVNASVKVDFSKVRVGDYVTVRTRVISVDPGADAIPINIDYQPWAYEVIGHEPSEKE